MRRRQADVGAIALLCALSLAWFNRVLLPGLTGKTLLPFDNLYAFEPFHSLRPDVVPYNALVSDLVLESTVWELAARASLAAGQLPLWNPSVMAGVPLLGHAQSSVLYPLDLLLLWLPLETAFGWSTALHVALAGVGMYIFGRVLDLRRPAALLAGVAFMFSGFLITSATFPQVLGAAAWFPLLLAAVERFIQRRSVWTWLCGVVIVALQFLAGHPEISLYGLTMVVAYAAIRLVGARDGWAVLGVALVIGLGTALAGLQLLPTYEAISSNARVGARSAQDLIAVAWPLPQLWTLLLPDLFGNPTHRQWLDLTSASWQATQEPIFWGTKNYVEAGQYLGITTLLLAIVGLLGGRRRNAAVFGGIAFVSALLVLGSPIYLVLQAVPGVDQLRSPFRAVFPFTIAACMLAGVGADALLRNASAARLVSRTSLIIGGVVLATLAVSLVWSEPMLKLAQRFVTDPAWAERAFGKAGLLIPQALPTPRAFWGYESLGLLRLGVFAVAGGLALRQRGVAPAIALVVLDLYSVHGGFLPATDVGLAPWASHKPGVIEAIDQLEATNPEPWRFTTFERGDEKTLLANAAGYYGWQDVRGYDSIVPLPYAELTRRMGLTPSSLAFNRIAPVYDAAPLRSGLLNLLNVKYMLSEQPIDEPIWREVYRDAHIAAYRNISALPRSFVAPFARVVPAAQQPLERTDPRDVVYLEDEPASAALTSTGRGSSRVVRYASNEVELEADVDGPAWLVLADAWSPGWNATASNSDTGQTEELEVYRAYGALRAIWLPAPGPWRVDFTYWPESVRLGLALSATSAIVLFLIALATWLMSRRTAWAADRSAPNRPLRAPYSPAGRGA